MTQKGWDLSHIIFYTRKKKRKKREKEKRKKRKERKEEEETHSIKLITTGAIRVEKNKEKNEKT